MTLIENSSKIIESEALRKSQMGHCTNVPKAYTYRFERHATHTHTRTEQQNKTGEDKTRSTT